MEGVTLEPRFEIPSKAAGLRVTLAGLCMVKVFAATGPLVFSSSQDGTVHRGKSLGRLKVDDMAQGTVTQVVVTPASLRLARTSGPKVLIDAAGAPRGSRR